MPPPRTVKTLKGSIAKVENIRDRESTSLFLTLHCQSPLDDAEKVTFLNGAGPGSTPQKPLALVANMSDSERRALEFGRRGAEPATGSGTTPLGIQYGTSIQHPPLLFFS